MDQVNRIQEKFHKFMNEMDFISQDKALMIVRMTFILVAVISYGIGFYFQHFSICVYSILATMVLLTIMIMPGGWPWWRQAPRQFAKPKKD